MTQEKKISSMSTDTEMHRKGTTAFFRLERQRLYDALEEKEQQLSDSLEMLVQLITLTFELEGKRYIYKLDEMYEEAREILLKKIENKRKGES